MKTQIMYIICKLALPTFIPNNFVEKFRTIFFNPRGILLFGFLSVAHFHKFKINLFRFFDLFSFMKTVLKVLFSFLKPATINGVANGFFLLQTRVFLGFFHINMPFSNESWFAALCWVYYKQNKFSQQSYQTLNLHAF